MLLPAFNFKNIIYFRSVIDSGEKVEITRDPKHKGAVIVELVIAKDVPPMFTCVKENRMYYPRPPVVYKGEGAYLGFYKWLLPHTYLPNFEVMFALNDDLYAIPVRTLISLKDIIKDRGDSLGAMFYVPFHELKGYSLHT